MGMLINGTWRDEDQTIVDGHYIRQTSAFSQNIDEQTIAQIATQPGRYVLIGSNSCQWSHRAMICRVIKGLSDYIPLHIAHGPRKQGYAVNGGAPWPVPGSDKVPGSEKAPRSEKNTRPAKEITHLHQLYTLSHNTVTSRSTVPVLWDSHEQKIISNESTRIMIAFDKAGMTLNNRQHSAPTAIPSTLYPLHCADEMSELDADIYHGLSNGVYKAGFAQSQEAYENAVAQVFATLDKLETRLSAKRYLMGGFVTGSDIKLFTTLLRFDAVYYTLHRCSKKRLIDYPNLWGYARDLYAQKGVSATVDFKTIRQASYQNDTDNNPHNIIPVAPEADWNAPHERDQLD